MGGQAHEERPALYQFRFATAEFDEGRFELRVAGRHVEIQRRPLEVLGVLLRHAGEVVTRGHLEQSVWHSRPTRAHVIHAAVTRLRSALGEENAGRIVTVARVGYRLTGSIERIAVGRNFVGQLLLDEHAVVSRRESFVLASRLSQSSHHDVWLARHLRTGEPRVYKFSADGEGLAALKREATFARVLQKHLGDRRDLVRFLGWNFAAPPFFLEYEYGGSSLLEWAHERLHGLAIEARIELFLQVADAVAAVHSVGVLHEDLKPANLLISQNADGERNVRVADFGSARLLEPERLQGLGMTQLDATVSDGVVSDGMATLLYMAPERLAGCTATVRSDVFALGVLLCQLLVGDLRRPLLPGWERNVPDRLLREDILAATDGDPAHRLASVTELTERIRRRGARRAERAREEVAIRAAVAADQRSERSRARRACVLVGVSSLALGLSLTLASRWRVSVERGHSLMTATCGPPARPHPPELALQREK